MDYAQYRKYDAVGLASLVAAGDVTAEELLEAAIERCEAVNRPLNAVTTPMYGIAGRRAREELSGALAGVPFLIKDLMQDYKGLPTGSGSKALRHVRATAHSTVVQRWLDAGLVIFGKTNTPEFGLKGITEPQAGGVTRNPWNLSHTAGGSSGGAAAAVAAGIVPVAGASDGGGSIRIPAACCGVFGLKPGRGVVSCGPHHAEYLHGAATEGVISRTVRDSAVMLDVLTAKPDMGGPYLVARPDLSYATLAERDPGRLRIGYSTRSPLETDVHAEAVAAVSDAAALLAHLGHEVEPAEPAIDGRQLASDFIVMWCTQVAVTVDEVQKQTGASADDFELDTQALAAVGRAVSATEYYSAHERWNSYSRQLGAFHEKYDVLLTPTIARPPVRIGQLDTPPVLNALLRPVLRLGIADKFASTSVWKNTVLANLATVPFTQLANITGRPAMSVPTYRTAAGLPLGVQFVGGLASEGLLLSLANQIETERPWAHLEPV
ncbi:amidase [Hoyosella altamirensis]|uniref:amidase n=1 Tax=Hoyosella altamirensis TaxID=616997 RepID=A0A839RKD4_9ACTN|nr:amidase [Hoyosella altamirensis]MBB3036769.1 amidase [Hoyosella altamirensis]